MGIDVPHNNNLHRYDYLNEMSPRDVSKREHAARATPFSPKGVCVQSRSYLEDRGGANEIYTDAYYTHFLPLDVFMALHIVFHDPYPLQ